MENLSGMVFNLYLLRPYDAFHSAVFGNDECGAVGAEIGAACHLLLSPHAKLLHQLLLCVGDEREGKAMLLFETLVRFLAVHAHSNHGKSLLLQRVVIVTQVACFVGAAWSGVLGIEIQHQLLAGKVAQTYLPAIFISPQNFWNLIAYLYHIGWVKGCFYGAKIEKIIEKQKNVPRFVCDFTCFFGKDIG